MTDSFFVILPALFSGVPSLLLTAAGYVLTAMALYTIAQRRQIDHPWLAWVPVANSWIVGSISDQYQYLVKGQNKSKRKLLLILNILSAVLGVTIVILGVALGVGVFLAHNHAQMLSSVMGPAVAILGLCVPMLGVAIAAAVIRYMALYDIYRSLDPDNSVLFLVLTIFFGITAPFFLFFNRNKDTGMPPRKQPEPVSIPTYEAPQEPWETE